MTKSRNSKSMLATSEASWLGRAAREIDVIASFGPSSSAHCARLLRDAMIAEGAHLLSYDPRYIAHLHFGPRALARIEEEHRKAREGVAFSNRLMSDYLQAI